MPPYIIHWDIQHLQRMGVQYCAGHLGGTYQRLGPHDPGRYQYHQTGLFSQQVWLQLSVIASDNDG